MRSGLSHDAGNNPGLTGQFPRTNYTRIVDDNHYQYPPPDSRGPTRKVFPDMTSPNTEKPTEFYGEGGGQEYPKYAPPHTDAQAWSQMFSRTDRDFSLNGFPSWAIPSSVFPQTTPPRSGGRFSSSPATVPDFASSWNNMTNVKASTQSNPPSTFDAAKWHEQLRADNIFRSDEVPMRKSPSKTSRAPSKPSNVRGRAQSRGADEPSEAVNGTDKSTAFHPGKLDPDWAAKATAHPKATRKSPDSGSTDSHDRYVVVEEDAMDVDTPPTNGAQLPTPNGVKQSVTTQPSTEHKRRWSHGGVDLTDFAQQAPFASTAKGLGGLKDDLETHLPFESRAAKDLKPNSSSSVRLRALNLPKPPKAIVPPSEDRLDKSNFDQYVENMQVYMRDWNNFNAKMIEHFRTRQDQVCGTMSLNWIGQLGDGPDAEALENDERGDKHAGYAAYLQWLKDDGQCRDWWEEANEKHLRCIEDLGRAREVAKRNFRPA